MLLLGRSIICSQLPDPDIAILNRIPVILQADRGLLGVLGWVGSQGLVPGRTKESLPVMNQHSVVDDSDNRRSHHLAFLVIRSFKNNVKALPFPLRSGRVDPRRRLPIKSSCLAIGIGLVGMTLTNLHLIKAHQEHSAVSSSLPLHLASGRHPVFKVQLTIAESRLGAHAPSPRYRHYPVNNRPVVTIPGIGALLPNQNQSIPWRLG